MKKANIIAIDGPAGSGKSTLGKKLAKHLGYIFFDTGVMYRAVAYAAVSRDVDAHKKKKVGKLAHRVQIDIVQPSVDDGRDNDVLLDGEDITWEVRSKPVEACVSIVAKNSRVREALTGKQREIGLKGNIVMVGRDIGTVVLPDADVKIYLGASAEERAQRRWLELTTRGEKVDMADILEGIKGRDLIDSTRKNAPLKFADDAIYLDSNGLDAEEVLAKAIEIIGAYELGEGHHLEVEDDEVAL